MTRVYLLVMSTVYYDFETHYTDQNLGIYDSLPNAKEALYRFVEEHIDEDGRYTSGPADEWTLIIFECEVNTDHICEVDNYTMEDFKNAKKEPAIV